MNLNSLDRELPPSIIAQERREKESQDAFRAAALSLTSLFKVGKKASSAAFLAGKLEAFGDVLEFVQSGLDENGSGNLNIERFINYICGRQETLRAEEEGEGEDEESAKPIPVNRPSFPPKVNSRPNSPAQASPSRPSIPILQNPMLPPPSPSLRRTESSHHHRHEPIASSSSSSAPPSPNHFNNSIQSFTTNTTLSSPSLPLMTLANSSPNTILPSPLTRLQVRRDREKDKKGKSVTSSRSSLSNPTIPVTESMIISDGNLKRRWTSGPVNVNNSIEIELETGTDLRIDFGGEVEFGEDEDMDGEGETKRRKLCV